MASELNFDNGLVTVSIPATIDFETRLAMMKELDALNDKHPSPLLRRAISRRAKELAGSEIWISECGLGVLVRSEEDGRLVVQADGASESRGNLELN